MKNLTLTVNKTLSGYLEISAIINNERFSQKFQGFTLSEAKHLFRCKFDTNYKPKN